MEHERRVTIAATPAAVWAVMADVARWPEWTASVDRAEVLDGGPLREGSRVRLKQPRLPAATWEVTELTEERSFRWTAPARGLRSTADHRIDPGPSAGEVTVTLRISQTGPLAVVARAMGSLTRRYVELEATGLKRRVEAGSPGPG